MKVKRELFVVGFWALAVWVMVLGQWALVIGNGIDLGCSDNDVHTATTQNVVGNWTVIDHPLTNGNPDAIVFATQNWNPGGGAGTYNDAAIGVFYDGAKWAIFNQYESPDPIAAMPEGASFNFKVVPPSESVFIHTATAGNINSNLTVIDHPLTNGNPDTLLFVEQNWNPAGGAGTYNDAAIGVWYDGGKWTIFNQDISSMPVGADFNVKVVLPCESAFVHMATVGNIVSFEPHRTVIDHPMANGNPDAILLVTQNWNPGGAGGTYNSAPTGVWYNGSQWEIFNQDFSGMSVGAAFNVMVFPTSDNFVHINTPASGGNTARIDNTLTNGNPDALLFVTQNWSPGGTYNDSSIGVWYNNTVSKWGVFNQDLDLMPESASFNVKVATASDSTFVHTATALNILYGATKIGHPLTTNHSEVLLFVTQNWNPGGLGGTYNNSPILVSWNGLDQWSIFNEDETDVPLGAAFNIKVVLPSESAFIHTATVGNIFGNTTDIDHPMTNDNPNARLLVTQSWHLGGAGGARNNSPIGVWYNGSNSKWAIFNQYFPSEGPSPAMPVGATFNVMVLTECELGCVPCTCDEVDYNGDGIVNLADYARLAEAWLEHELLVDLAAPSAIVDEADLEEFVRHWLESCD